MSSESPYMTQHFGGEPLWRNSAAQRIGALATVMLNDITDTPNIACCVPLSSKSSRGREIVQRQQVRNQALFQSGHLVSPNAGVSWYSQFCRAQAAPYPQPLTEPHIDWRIIWKGTGAPEHCLGALPHPIPNPEESLLPICYETYLLGSSNSCRKRFNTKEMDKFKMQPTSSSWILRDGETEQFSGH